MIRDVCFGKVQFRVLENIISGPILRGNSWGRDYHCSFIKIDPLFVRVETIEFIESWGQFKHCILLVYVLLLI